MCGVCFGSGLRNVRGLLRRPEATGMVLRMQHGELRPGQCICYIVTCSVTHILLFIPCVSLMVKRMQFGADATGSFWSDNRSFNAFACLSA